MIRINFYHSLIFFNLCILLSGIEYLREGSFLIISLFLILTIGISHGSLDHIKGKKLIKYFGYKSMSIFHFGKEDSEFINQKKNFELIYFFKGSLIITSPLFFHKEETIAIFETLNFNISNNLIISDEILFVLVLLSLISGIILSFKKNIEVKSLLLMDYLSIIILNYFLNPIIAFTIYFCFLHSIRHSISLIREINKNLTKGLPIFIKKALPLTILIILGYIISISVLSNYNEFNETIYRVIFIGLASLTFPHILLEYLIEKNEQ
jgi:Brp/Blh family beta-carotene 15,15'-monooxygenase